MFSGIKNNIITFINRVLKRKWFPERSSSKSDIDVYFIPGMCYNCKIFDQIELPKGYCRKYIEWYQPHPEDSLSNYAQSLAEKIDTSHPFILVGYSFGAILVQEIRKFLVPQKTVIISSFKKKEETPQLFRTIRKIKILKRVPNSIFNQTQFLTESFNLYFYNIHNKDMEEYLAQINPIYIRWAVEQIIQWSPDIKLDNLYHIHGTQDQIFPFERITDVYPVENGDHLMLIKQPEKVSILLASILLRKEEKK